MTVRGDMLNGHGVCHGGFLFALADTAFAYACNSAGVAMVAAGASIEFLAPAAAGERLIAAATESSRSERQGIYDVAVRTESGATRAHFRGRCARFRTGAAQAAATSTRKDQHDDRSLHLRCHPHAHRPLRRRALERPAGRFGCCGAARAHEAQRRSRPARRWTM